MKSIEKQSLLSRLFHYLLYGPTDGMSREQRDQVFEINAYSLLGWAALTVFGLLHVTGQTVFIGQLELILGGALVLNVIGLKLTRDIGLARTLHLLIILMVLMMLLVLGGTQDTGIFWLFVYPLLVFFLAGRRQGVWWIGLMALTIAVIVSLAELDIIGIPYSFVTIRQLLISLIVVSIGVYIYESARENALSELHDNRRDLQEHLDHMATFSLKVGASGNIKLANKAAKDASGLGDNLVGTNFLECSLWSFDDVVCRRVEAAFYKALSGHTVNYDEKFKVTKPNGPEVITVNFSLLPIFGPKKRIKYVLAEARDISTEQAVDRAKSEFMALASQRLGDPLLDVSSTAERLINGSNLQPDQLKELHRIYSRSKSMAALIDDMLLTAKLELEDFPVTPNTASPAKLSDGVIKQIKTEQLANRKLEIHAEYQDNLPDIPLDSFIFEKILNNLISNAVTYTSDGGHIYVRLNRIDEKLYPESKGSLQLVVQDNGRGIPQTEQAKVFKKFSRASNGGPADRSGTGLGLYIVKSLTEYVGGAIAFRSEEKVGSTFIVTLPIEGMAAKS